MPHRDSEFSEVCEACGERTESGCKRCGLPLCRVHAPPDDRRCDGCENEFAITQRRRAHLLNVKGAGWLMVGVGAIVGAGLMLTPTYSPLALLVGIWVAVKAGRFIGKDSLRIAEIDARRHFLEETPGARLTGWRRRRRRRELIEGTEP